MGTIIGALLLGAGIGVTAAVAAMARTMAAMRAELRLPAPAEACDAVILSRLAKLRSRLVGERRTEEAIVVNSFSAMTKGPGVRSLVHRAEALALLREHGVSAAEREA